VSAGLPGLGLGGIFFLVSALLAPLVELVRTARGESSLASWLGVGRQFGLAVAMIVAVDGALRLVYLLGSVVGVGDGQRASAIVALPLLPLLVTLSLVALVLAAAKGMDLGVRTRAGEFAWIASAGRLPSGSQIVSGVGALTVIWLALLIVGATNLGTPLAGLGPSFGGGSGSRESTTSYDGREAPDARAPELVGRALPGFEASRRMGRRGERRDEGGEAPGGGGGRRDDAKTRSEGGPAGLADAAPAAPPGAEPGSGAPRPRSPEAGDGPSPGTEPVPSTGNVPGQSGGSEQPPSRPAPGASGGTGRGSPPDATPSGRDTPATSRRANPASSGNRARNE